MEAPVPSDMRTYSKLFLDELSIFVTQLASLYDRQRHIFMVDQVVKDTTPTVQSKEVNFLYGKSVKCDIE